MKKIKPLKHTKCKIHKIKTQKSQNIQNMTKNHNLPQKEKKNINDTKQTKKQNTLYIIHKITQNTHNFINQKNI